ncbi:MAG TPA: succinate dehydrogenase, hydrophobic membrane anchor protein [Steroidobacteraceae bacterium]|jgi:succinate dehydrogenase / fumarate reductase membrane anchor subunit|nr:succinate dehydrogenase, hydrophobic membrane anchor protein [Steroidobacteraceae bacterium]
MSLQSPLGRVLGLGSAKDGVHHWWVQRLTSIALIPLTVWFVVSLFALPAFDHSTVVSWMAHGWTALLLVIFIAVSVRHSQLGVQVVVEDYVHGGTKTLSLIVSTFAHIVVAAAAIFAVLKVAFGSVA